MEPLVELICLLWMESLSVPDPIYVAFTPILAALFTFVTQKFTMAAQPVTNPDDPNAKTQKIMLYAMPIMIGYISISMPAGVALYWVVKNIFTFVQQFIMMKIPRPIFPSKKRNDGFAKRKKNVKLNWQQNGQQLIPMPPKAVKKSLVTNRKSP